MRDAKFKRLVRGTMPSHRHCVVTANWGDPMSDQVAVARESLSERNANRSISELDSVPKRPVWPQPTLDEKALVRDAARRLLCSGQLSTAELYRELARSNDDKPRSWTRSFVRRLVIGLAAFAVWFAASIAIYQENPGDIPTIVALFSV